MAAGLTAILADEGLEILRFAEGTRTADDAARAIGCTVAQIVKSLVFLAGTEPVLALVSGANRLDPSRLSKAAGGREVRKADAERTREATGFAIGGVPPFGHVAQLAVFVDPDLLQYPLVWAAAGRPDSVFAISPARLVEISRAQITPLKEERG